MVCHKTKYKGANRSKHQGNRDTLPPELVSKNNMKKYLGALTQVTADVETSNAVASSVTVIVTLKKSKASQIQPRNPDRNMSHWWRDKSRRI